MKILVIEDDKDINTLIQKVLGKQGYEVTPAYSGTEGQLRLRMERYDLMICDLMLPGLSGEELIKEVRQKEILPILVLTAKGGIEDKINVLGLGADDYMTKPFDPRELVVRVQVHLRRMQIQESGRTDQFIESVSESQLECRDLILYPDLARVTLNGKEIRLTSHEFDILRIMMLSPQRVFSKEALYEAVWKNGYYGEDNTISVHISNIRKKLAEVSKEEYISTVWGIGFRMNL